MGFNSAFKGLTVIQSKVSPTLKVAVYYLCRESRGNKKKSGNGRKLVFKLGIMWDEEEGKGGGRRQGTSTPVSFSPVGANLYAP